MQDEVGEALMEAAKRGCFGVMMERDHLGHGPLQRLKYLALAQCDLWRWDTAFQWKNERQWGSEIGKIPFTHQKDLLYGQG